MKRRIVIWGGIVFLTVIIYLFFLDYSRVGTYSHASVAGMLTGSADKPYVQRVLLSMIANLLAPLIPPGLANWAVGYTEIYFGRTFEIFNGYQYPNQVIIILLAMYSALLGFAIVVWKFIGAAGYGEFWQMLATPLILCVIPFLTFNFGHIYDFPGLFLFSLALYLLYSENWRGYYPVFVLAILNKETALFLILVFGIYYWSRLDRLDFWKKFAIQCSIALVLRTLIQFIYRANPGQNLEWHFLENVRFAQENPLLMIQAILFLIALGVLIAIQWTKKPLFLRTALIILPLFVMSYIFWGVLFELRIFLDVYMIVALLILPSPPISSLSKVFNIVAES